MSATLNRRTMTVVLFDGADLERIDELAEAVASKINVTGPRRIADSSEVSDAASAYDAFVTEAEARARKVQVEALKRSAWRDLQLAHPPRKVTVTEKRIDADGVEVSSSREVLHEDDEIGFNTETMDEALVPVSIAAGQFTQGELVDFLDDLSSPHWARLYSAAVVVNTSGSTLPKANMSSRVAQIGDEISTSPSRLG